jgi:glyoxylate reductase
MAEPVFLSRRVPGPIQEELAGTFDLVQHDSEWPPSREELLAAIAGKTGVVTMLTDKVDDEFLEAAGPQLRVVANYAVGFDNIDVEAATRHGVVATNTPDVLTDATAEFAFALILAAARRVGEGDRFLRRHEPWTWAPTMMLGMTLGGRTLGIVGLGRIGRVVARLGEAFGMRVVYTDFMGPFENAGYDFVTLEELLAQSDVVSVHCPLTPDTRHLINADRLAAMQPHAILVNTSRGPVVDEAALADALASGEIAAAGLDVYEREPEVNEKLLTLENVVLAPHLASAAEDTRIAMGQLVVGALRGVLLENRCPPNALNPEVWQAA